MADYGEHILELQHAVRSSTRLPGKKTERLLSALHKEAKALNDNGLLGFVYYHYADRYYFMTPDPVRYRRYILLAVRHLLESDNRETLGFTYNQVAVEAHNGGSYTIAYQYYLAALTIGRELRKSPLSADVGANIGRLMTELGYHDLAKTYLAESLRQTSLHKERALYKRNMVTLCYLCGINAMNLGLTESAKDYLKRIAELAGGDDDNILHLVRLFLNARIALEEGDDTSLDQIMNDLIPGLAAARPLYDFMEDISYLCTPLLNHGKTEPVRRILDETVTDILKCGNTHTERMYYELMLRYDREAGNDDRILNDMQLLHECLTREYGEQSRRSIEAIKLSSIMAELRKKQKDVVMENSLLQKQADTDALTGLPNRYAMNDALEAAFDRAKANVLSLGIGILDVDYFKEYNDNYGHQAGDVCLNAIAGCLQRLTLRTGVFCARYGGDEFVIVCPDATKEGLKSIAESLSEDLFMSRIRHGYSRISDYVTVSQGYCLGVPGEDIKIWEYLAKADKALYSVKQARLSDLDTVSVRIMGFHDGEAQQPV